jgi:predicted nucleotidyltransferase
LVGVRAQRDRIVATARRWGAADVRVFGSVARGEAGLASDIDFLVRFEPGRSLLDQVHLIEDLTAILGLRIDVVSEAALLARDQQILDEAVAL